MQAVHNFWGLEKHAIIKHLSSSENGLTERQARKRLQKDKDLKHKRPGWYKDLLLLIAQYKNPLILLLVFAVLLSVLVGEYSDSAIILLVLLFTGLFGFIQERNASKAVEELRALVHNTARVKRSGIEKEIPIEQVVPGDIVILNAGDIIPADSFILQANDLHINQAVLTGESFPAEKFDGRCAADASLSQITNAVFKGTSVINGTATVVAVNVNANTEIGRIAASLDTAPPETAFEKGTKQFGYLLMRISIVIVLFILILNVLFHRPLVDSLLFSLALAIGLTPELLPAITTVTLSAGAKRMAEKKVIVKKLSAIQNLGEINVLCSDKTGTLTEGQVKLHGAFDVDGNESQKVLSFAYLNASFETGFSNVIDDAIRSLKSVDISGYAKVDEVPYDFIRKRLSVVVSIDQKHTMITKGAIDNVIQVCTKAEVASGKTVALDSVRSDIEEKLTGYNKKGFRTIAIAWKDVTSDPVITKDDEQDMTFLGFIVMFDPPKKGITNSLSSLQSLGIKLKLISGDNRLVVQYLGAQVGLSAKEVLTGSQLHKMTSEALESKVASIDLYAEIEPAQKEWIIKSLQKTGRTVGYLGDGINDANALRAADVGISIENAVDVAKEAADLVLLQQNLDVICDGVSEGRKTFNNTLKYIFITTSANFGNMFSMAIASLALPFLPLLPTQILLNNFLSDMPALTIASDRVDVELMQKPTKWDMNKIKRFMIVFGIQSSLFDFATFALLLFVFKASVEEFRTGWFIESVLSEILILLVIRTERPFFKSMPSRYLFVASCITFVLALLLPYLPFASIFSFIPLPLSLLAAILGISIVYILVAEMTKQYFMKKV